MDDQTRLRRLLGEEIPEGGSHSDTLFSGAELDFLIKQHGSVESSLGEAWRMKAASLANLVNTTEGTSKRSLSDLHTHAVRMVEHYGVDPLASVPSVQTRVHQIERA